MAFASTYDLSGGLGSAAANREDIVDFLTHLDPEETPILSMVGKEKAHATLVETPIQKPADPAWAGVAEGTDATYNNKASNRGMIYNNVQQFMEGYQVSRTQEAVAQAKGIAGVDSEVAESEILCMQEMKRNIECAFSGRDDRTVEASGTAGEMRGLGCFIADIAGTSAAGDTATQAPSEIPSIYRTPTASINETVTGSFSEDDLNDVMQSRYEAINEKGENLTLVAGPALKRACSNFLRDADAGSNYTTPALRVMVDGKADELSLCVEQYKGDFGRCNILTSMVLNRTNAAPTTARSQSGFLLDFKFLKARYLVAESESRHEDKGGGPRGHCQAILTLTCSNPLAFGKFDAAS